MIKFFPFIMEQINGFDMYEIHLVRTPDGQPAVWNNKYSRYLKPRIGKQGYNYVRLYKDGKHTQYRISRIVAEHFIHNPKDHPWVDHIDRDPTNNKIQNLRWVSIAENNHNRQKSKGYYYDKQRKKWRGSITINGKCLWSPRYNTEQEAKEWHIKASKQYYPNIKYR